jgi:endonuclease G
MQLSKKQWFGIISLVILLIAAYLVTREPWLRSSGDARSSLVDTPPENIRIQWEDLATGYPRSPLADTIRSYTGFDLAYNEEFEQAAWVVYVLTGSEIETGEIGRTDDFRADSSIRSGSAELRDYRGSGYDRGHLAPAGDMKWDARAMSESFLMSNMSPQSPAFNRGIWSKLEMQVRDWAIEKDSLYVITGPVLQAIDTSIGPNEVAVPPFYFKVLVDLSPPDHSMIAFLLPNAKSSENLLQFAIPVDSLELLTGYDFFAAAPEQEVIAWMEARLDRNSWQ